MSSAHDVPRQQQNNNYIAAQSAALYIELASNSDGTPKLDIYLLDNGQKIVVDTSL